jgi:hypothetical protein
MESSSELYDVALWSGGLIRIPEGAQNTTAGVDSPIIQNKIRPLHCLRRQILESVQERVATNRVSRREFT